MFYCSFGIVFYFTLDGHVLDLRKQFLRRLVHAAVHTCIVHFSTNERTWYSTSNVLSSCRESSATSLYSPLKDCENGLCTLFAAQRFLKRSTKSRDPVELISSKLIIQLRNNDYIPLSGFEENNYKSEYKR